MQGWRAKVLAGSVGVLLLAAAGFAAAAIASGGSLGHVLSSLAGTTETSTTETSTTETSATELGMRKVTLCHRTHSWKHRWVTITVGAPAVRAHLRHGDTVGACSDLSTATRSGGRHSEHGNSNQSSSSGSSRQSSGSDAQGGNGHGNGRGGHGGGKP